MTGLEADEVELEDYFNILFNSSEATDLLAASTGANAEAQQAVIDALEGDTEVSFHFLAPTGAQEMLMFVRMLHICLEQSIFIFLAQIFKQSVSRQ